ncbi:MAG: type II toxin-antitoxin system prevent-host-death family antitoxin [Cellulosilyticaceae bacterium]
MQFNILDFLIPITQFNKGQASRIFDRLRTEKQLVVLKNNAPSAVILSPEEYARLAELEEDYALLLEATNRLAQTTSSSTLPFEAIMANLGISEEDLDDAEDVIIE